MCVSVSCSETNNPFVQQNKKDLASSTWRGEVYDSQSGPTLFTSCTVTDNGHMCVGALYMQSYMLATLGM